MKGWTTIPVNNEHIDTLKAVLSFAKTEYPKFEAFLEYFNQKNITPAHLDEFIDTIEECKKELVQ